MEQPLPVSITSRKPGVVKERVERLNVWGHKFIEDGDYRGVFGRILEVLFAFEGIKRAPYPLG